MGKQLISKAEFARRAGVSGAAITKAIKAGLSVAMEGKRIDAIHPAAVAYMENKNKTVTLAKAPPPPKRGTAAAKDKMKKGPAPPPPDDENLLSIPDDIRAFADMSLRELVQRFGTDLRFVDWLKATKVIEDINEKRLKNAVSKGELVSRARVKIGVIDPVNTALEKLLTDGANTIAMRAVAMVGAEKSIEDVEAFVKDQISSFIRPMKAKISRALKNG